MSWPNWRLTVLVLALFVGGCDVGVRHSSRSKPDPRDSLSFNADSESDWSVSRNSNFYAATLGDTMVLDSTIVFVNRGGRMVQLTGEEAISYLMAMFPNAVYKPRAKK